MSYVLAELQNARHVGEVLNQPKDVLLSPRPLWEVEAKIDSSDVGVRGR